MVKFFLICALILIAGDFVCYGDLSKLTNRISEFASAPNGKDNHFNLVAAIDEVVGEIKWQIPYVDTPVTIGNIVPERESVFKKVTSVFEAMHSTLTPDIVLHFSVEIWSLLDELQKVTRVKSKYEDDAWDAAAKYTTHNTIQAIEKYSVEVSKFSAAQIIANIKGVEDLFALSARPGFHDQIRKEALGFSKSTIKLLDALTDADHIQHLHIIWPNVRDVCDVLDMSFKLNKDDDYESLCESALKLARYIHTTLHTKAPHEFENGVIEYLIILIQHSQIKQTARRKKTFAARFRLYIEAPRECLTEERPIDPLDIPEIFRKEFLELVAAELSDPNIISEPLLNELCEISKVFTSDTEVRKKIIEMYEHIAKKYDSQKKLYDSGVSIAKEMLASLEVQ